MTLRKSGVSKGSELRAATAASSLLSHSAAGARDGGLNWKLINNSYGWNCRQSGQENHRHSGVARSAAS
ncbi:hypothetical protein V5799_008537 [Amblyomma americanum]|uniref:Uncharacterized protein n=1 Tax=Amblyomma americanum TaxID=6943 RepID=A0AAQ4FEM9_AMBAM